MKFTSLRELADHAMTIASDIYQKNGSFAPFWLVQEPGDGQVHMIITPYDSDASKAAYVALIKITIKTMEAQRYCTASECWMLEASTADKVDIEKINREGVRNQPGRIEAISVSGEDRNGDNGTNYRKIESAHEPRILGPENPLFGNHAKGHMMGGRMFDLFEDGRRQ